MTMSTASTHVLRLRPSYTARLIGNLSPKRGYKVVVACDIHPKVSRHHCLSVADTLSHQYDAAYSPSWELVPLVSGLSAHMWFDCIGRVGADKATRVCRDGPSNCTLPFYWNALAG